MIDRGKSWRKFAILIAWPTLLATPLWADHALTQEGTGLFNVSVEQTATTWSRPLRVRWKDESFEYDYDRHEIVHARTTGSSLYWLADIVTTDTIVGKDEARTLMRDRGWNKYIPPLPPVVVLPTPTPVPTLTPAPVATVAPTELADAMLPLDRRIEKQREIFLDQQQALSNELALAQKMHLITEEEAKHRRIDLLRRQIQVLERYYPGDHEQVRLTKEALQDQIEHVEKNGRFKWEI